MKPPPTAGELRYSIAIQTASTTTSTETGLKSTTWSTTRSTRAKREFKQGGSGEGLEEDLQLVGVQTVIYCIRKQQNESITVDHNRVVDSGKTYDITKVQPIGYGQEMFWMMECVERNNFDG